MNSAAPSGTGVSPVDPVDHSACEPFQIDIGVANQLISEWTRIAAGVARQCQWRLRGQCLISCPGLAVCDRAGLTPVDGNRGPGFPPADLQP
jgi:hypothetical protein